MVTNKKLIISHVVALILGFAGGLFGRDLSGLQKPAEQAATVAVDAAAQAAAQAAAGKATAEALKKLEDAAPPPPAPVKADAAKADAH